MATFIFGFAVGAGVLVFTADRYSASGLTWASSSSGSEWYSYIGGKRFVALASSADLAASAKWRPGDPLPLRPEDAISKAQDSLRKLGPPAADWSLAEITVSEGKQGEFLYTVLFQPNAHSLESQSGLDGARLLVYFNGNVTLPVADSAP